jgi:hypothetical protein
MSHDRHGDAVPETMPGIAALGVEEWHTQRIGADASHARVAGQGREGTLNFSPEGWSRGRERRAAEDQIEGRCMSPSQNRQPSFARQHGASESDAVPKAAPP